MTATYNDTTDKLESAAQALVSRLTFELSRTINTGVDDDSYALPNVICSAEEGEEFPLTSGNFWTKLRVTLNTDVKGGTRQKHLADFRTLHDAFWSTDLETQLSTVVGNFAVQGIRERHQGRNIKEKCHSHWIELDCLACSTVLGWPEAVNLIAVVTLPSGPVTLTWEDPEYPSPIPDDAKWRIYRDDLGDETPLVELSSDTHTWVDSTVAPETDYVYTVKLEYE